MADFIDIEIATDTKAYKAFMKEYPTQASNAMQKALNKIGKSAEGAMIKEVTSIYNITAKRARSVFFLGKATRGNLVWQLSISKRKSQPNITSFGAKQTKTAVTVAIIKGRRQRFKGAFISKLMKKDKKTGERVRGGSAAFMRTESKTTPTRGRYKGAISSRAPSRGQRIQREGIEAIYGPQILKMFSNKNVQLVFEKKVAQRAAVVIAQEMKFAADKIIQKNKRK